MGDTFDLRSKWAAAVAAAGLDAVIFPPAALPALPHGGSRDLTPVFTYMFIANLLHWPAGVVPVAVVTDDEQVSAFHKHVSDRSFVFPLIHSSFRSFIVHLSFVTWLFHSFVISFIRSFVHWFFHFFIPSVVESSIDYFLSLFRSFNDTIQPLNRSFIHKMNPSIHPMHSLLHLIHPSTRSFIHPIDTSTHPFIRLMHPMNPFIHPFINPFTHSASGLFNRMNPLTTPHTPAV